jgi:hypothetical protein
MEDSNKEYPKCEDCKYLIERYGYCNVVRDWVTKPIGNLSFEPPMEIYLEDSNLIKVEK